MVTAERIDCPAPLPEDPATALLTEMLVPAPYKAPEKKAAGTRKGLRRKAVIDSSSEDGEADSSRGGGGKHEEIPPPLIGEEKKRKAAPQGEAKTPKKGKASLPDHSTTAAYSEEEWLPRGKPLARS